jgi:uroporphyrinogen-III synthase
MSSRHPSYSHVVITRPRQEALHLAHLLAPLPADVIILPAHVFLPLELTAEQLGQLQAAATSPAPTLLIFTSPRTVEFGLSQLPPEVVRASCIAAIGPSTGALLEHAGAGVDILPRHGYDSEHLLSELALSPPAHAAVPPAAFILAAPGGRTLIQESLQAIGYSAHTLMVYESKPAELDVACVTAIERARFTLAVWTSANAMASLARHLPAQCWQKLCQGDWLVISDRLAEVAQSYKPAKIRISQGPANEDIAAAVSALF